MITEQQKQRITEVLTGLKQKHSQNKLAIRTGVSSANISNMLNGKWERISDELWLKVAANLDMQLTNWQTAETSGYRKITQLIKLAQKRSMSIAIVGDAGAGKTHAYKSYERNFNNVVYVGCAFHFTQRTFIATLLRAMGKESAGLRLNEMIALAIRTIKQMNKPVIILDEADKLKDTPFMLYIDLYNQLDGYAGFVLSGAPFLKLQIEKNAKRDKRGYREILSRIGRRFVQAEKPSLADIRAICQANGLNEVDYKEIYHQSMGDLRRVKRIIEKQQELQAISV